MTTAVGPTGDPAGVSRVALALAAGTASWEGEALERLAAAPTRVALVKRCLDLSDLLAVAATGTVRVAVLAQQLPGLDVDSVERLRRAAVRTVVVLPSGASESERERVRRLGVTWTVAEEELTSLVATLERAAEAPAVPQGLTELLAAGDAPVLGPAEGVALPPADASGRVVAVWGPHGAPGRTTVAIGLAAEAAHAGVPTTLVDADPYGGAVGQHLAVLDEVSGLLAAVRLANAGQLDETRLVGLARQLDDRLRLVTGLPRPDRWPEVRPQTLATLLDVAGRLTPPVVVDAGFGLDLRLLEGRPATLSRDQLSMTSVEHADDLVVVASADPVGLTRLARSLLDLRDVRPAGPDLVVVNRMRPGLGWAERDVVDMVSRVTPAARVRFLPEDRGGADRALVGGRTLRDAGDGPLRRALTEMTQEHLVRVGLVPAPARRGRRRGSHRGPRRRRPQTLSRR